MHRRRRRAGEVLTASVVLGALVAPGAAAHVTVQPSASRPADLQRYRVIVPNEESTGTTTGVDLRMPAGVTFALVEATADWRSRLVKRGGAIAEIRWSAGRVPPGGYAELRFVARNPVRLGELSWKALQRYDDGEVVRWIGAKGSEQPAAITTLREDAVAVDVVSTHGEALPGAGGTARPAATPARGARVDDSAGAGTDWLARGLALAALLAALVAVALRRTSRGG